MAESKVYLSGTLLPNIWNTRQQILGLDGGGPGEGLPGACLLHAHPLSPQVPLVWDAR